MAWQRGPEPAKRRLTRCAPIWMPTSRPNTRRTWEGAVSWRPVFPRSGARIQRFARRSGTALSELAELVQGALPEEVPAEEARRRALALLSAMVGSVAMARAVEATNPELAKEIITAARTELEDLAVRRR